MLLASSSGSIVSSIRCSLMTVPLLPFSFLEFFARRICPCSFHSAEVWGGAGLAQGGG